MTLALARPRSLPCNSCLLSAMSCGMAGARPCDSRRGARRCPSTAPHSRLADRPQVAHSQTHQQQQQCQIQAPRVRNTHGSSSVGNPRLKPARRYDVHVREDSLVARKALQASISNWEMLEHCMVAVLACGASGQLQEQTPQQGSVAPSQGTRLSPHRHVTPSNALRGVIPRPRVLASNALPLCDGDF